jgi:outer membrane lipase/esterase
MAFPADPPAYSALVIFGDSLSDTGNNALALRPSGTPVPIPGNTFAPRFPYASGRYADAAVWADIAAAALGLSASPVLAGGTNFAFGGARLGPLQRDLLAPESFPPSVMTQVAAFLESHAGAAPPDALYVMAGGANTARDTVATALSILVDGGDPCGAISEMAATYAREVVAILRQLESAGAQRLIVWNVPDVGHLPAVRALDGSAVAQEVAAVLNATLCAALQDDPLVEVFDACATFNRIARHPGAFGFVNVLEACALCPTRKPAEFLFWDGIHPTTAAHAILADAMVDAIRNGDEISRTERDARRVA